MISPILRSFRIRKADVFTIDTKFLACEVIFEDYEVVEVIVPFPITENSKVKAYYKDHRTMLKEQPNGDFSAFETPFNNADEEIVIFTAVTDFSTKLAENWGAISEEYNHEEGDELVPMQDEEDKDGWSIWVYKQSGDIPFV